MSGGGVSGGGASRLAIVGLVGVLALGLAGCSGEDGDAALRAAQANVEAKQEAVTQAEAAVTSAQRTLCESSGSYITSVDRYGDILTQTAATVGDVRTAGEDLDAPREKVVGAAEEAQAARTQLERAQKDLAEAQASLASLQGSPAPEPSSTSPATLPAGSVERVKQAESDLAAAQKGITDETPLAEAGQQFNSAVVAVEVAWLQLFAESGCLTDDQQDQAVTAAARYTTALQEALAEAGYFEGEVDGVYGPATVEAIQALQKANGLPQTGAMDKATSAALQAELAQKGGAAAQKETASTAALQQTLKLTGYWDGPVDGKWTDELTDALKELQTDLGVEPTGEVDAETIEAFQKALERVTTSPSPSPSEPSDQPGGTASATASGAPPGSETPGTSPSAG